MLGPCRADCRSHEADREDAGGPRRQHCTMACGGLPESALKAPPLRNPENKKGYVSTRDLYVNWCSGW